MKKKYILIVADLLLVALVVVAYVAYTDFMKSRPTLMYFRADLWVVCKKVTPIVDGIKREYRGQLNVVYVDINRANGKELAKEHDVMGAPTIVLLDSAGNQMNVLRGAESQLVLEQAVEDFLAINATPDSD